MRAAWCIHPCIDAEVIGTQGTGTISIALGVLTETAEAVAAVRIEEPEHISTAVTQGRCGVRCRYCGILRGHNEFVGHPVQLIAAAEDGLVITHRHTEWLIVADGTHTTIIHTIEVVAVVDDPAAIDPTFTEHVSTRDTSANEAVTTGIRYTEPETTDRQAARFRDRRSNAIHVRCTKRSATANDRIVVRIKDLPSDL